MIIIDFLKNFFFVLEFDEEIKKSTLDRNEMDLQSFVAGKNKNKKKTPKDKKFTKQINKSLK